MSALAHRVPRSHAVFDVERSETGSKTCVGLGEARICGRLAAAPTSGPAPAGPDVGSGGATRKNRPKAI